jgi:hypothetical protein
MIAHERGHQLLARHPRTAKRVAGISEASEEILASLLGAMICDVGSDRVTLYAKATAALLERGQSAEAASRQLQELWNLLGAQLEPDGSELLVDLTVLIAVEAGIEPGGGDAETGQEVDLVLHQGDRRRDDNGQAVEQERRQLIAQPLATASG